MYKRREQEKKKGTEKNHKTISKIAITTYLSTNTWNINRPNALINRHTGAEQI